MGILKFKGCEIQITNQSNLISDAECEKFGLKYISHLLADEILPPDKHLSGNYFIYENKFIENKEKIKISVIDEDDSIIIKINNEAHISMKSKSFHDAQLLCDAYSSVHQSFFHWLHNVHDTGIGVMSS